MGNHNYWDMIEEDPSLQEEIYRLWQSGDFNGNDFAERFGCSKRHGRKILQKIREIIEEGGTGEDNIGRNNDDYDRIKMSDGDISKKSLEGLLKEVSRWQNLYYDSKSRTEDIARYLEPRIQSIDIQKYIGPVQSFNRRPRGEDQTAILNLGDWHVGSVVNPVEVQGLSAYNVEICKKRIDTLINKVLMFWEQDHQSLGLRKLVIQMLGDFSEGDGQVYRGQSLNSEYSQMDQSFIALEQMVKVVSSLSQVFGEIEIFCVVGNHGRVGDKGSSKSNWDDLVYRLLKLHFQATDRINVYPSSSPSMLYRLGDEDNYKTFCISHNLGAKSWNGLPFYGLTRSKGKMMEMYKYGGAPDYITTGHWHSTANFGGITINGSLVGGSDLSINMMGLNDVPRQILQYFDNKHGINRTSDLILDDEKILVADNNGILTPYYKG